MTTNMAPASFSINEPLTSTTTLSVKITKFSTTTVYNYPPEETSSVLPEVTPAPDTTLYRQESANSADKKDIVPIVMLLSASPEPEHLSAASVFMSSTIRDQLRSSILVELSPQRPPLGTGLVDSSLETAFHAGGDRSRPEPSHGDVFTVDDIERLTHGFVVDVDRTALLRQLEGELGQDLEHLWEKMGMGSSDDVDDPERDADDAAADDEEPATHGSRAGDMDFSIHATNDAINVSRPNGKLADMAESLSRCRPWVTQLVIPGIVLLLVKRIMRMMGWHDLFTGR